MGRTWMSTIIFALASVAIAWMSPSQRWALWIGITAVILTPILWWLLVERSKLPGRGRGAVVGALVGAAVQILPPLIAMASFYRQRDPSHQGLGDLVDVFMIAIMLLAGLAGAAICATVGAILARPHRLSAESKA